MTIYYKHKPGFNITRDNWKEKVPEMIVSYRILHEKSMAEGDPNKLSGHMMKELIEQYCDMARGGNGGIINNIDFRTIKGSAPVIDPTPAEDASTRYFKSTIRDKYYPDAPDEYFSEICDLMGWNCQHQ